MTISQALLVLHGCQFLKIGRTAATASRYHGWTCHVHVRLRKGETFEAMLVRAAAGVHAGQMPVKRKKKTKARGEPCGFCPAEPGRRIWVAKIEKFLCLKCASTWERAAIVNDMAPSKSKYQN